jgi:hypothetical protein
VVSAEKGEHDMVRPGLRGPTVAVNDGGLKEAAMKQSEVLQASEEPAAVPASTGRRWMSRRWMLLPAFSLLGESLRCEITQYPVQQVACA